MSSLAFTLTWVVILFPSLSPLLAHSYLLARHKWYINTAHALYHHIIRPAYHHYIYTSLKLTHTSFIDVARLILHNAKQQLHNHSLSFSVSVSERPPLKTKFLGLLTPLVITPFISLPYLTATSGSPITPFTNNCQIINASLALGLSFTPLVFAVRLRRLTQVYRNHTRGVPSALGLFMKMAVLFHSIMFGTCVYLTLSGVNTESAGGSCDVQAELLPSQLALLGRVGWVVSKYSGMMLSLVSLRYVSVLWKVRHCCEEVRRSGVIVGLMISGMGIGLIWPDVFVVGFFGVVVVPLVSYGILMWSTLRYTIRNDEEYLHKYTYGFPTTPTPEQMWASRDTTLIEPIKRFEETSMNPRHRDWETYTFPKECLDLDWVVDWYDRQAMARYLIEKYVLETAPRVMGISNATRQKILRSTDLADPLLFAQARREMITILKITMKDDEFDSYCSVPLHHVNIPTSPTLPGSTLDYSITQRD